VPLRPEWTELKQSLVNYGIPDITGMSLGSGKEREDFCRLIQSIIQQYEPRFKSVRVHLLSSTEALDRTFRFRIDALLHADPAPEPIVFDSTLEPATEQFEVKGAAG
jgi:type VI secretion system protein ImpF